MTNLDHLKPPQEWAEEQFGSADLGDERRVRRLVTMASAVASHPGGSLPQWFAHPYDRKAAYNLLAHPSVEGASVQEGHRDLVHESLSAPGTYLLLEDTTELDWSQRAPIAGLGPIGNSNEKTQGVLLHTVLAVRWPGRRAGTEGGRPPVQLLGLAHQQYHVRQPRPAAERALTHSHAGLGRARESQLWEQSGRALGDQPAEAEVRWVRVCDAGADIYEQLQSCADLGHGFVIRAAQDRVVVAADGRTRVGRLREVMATAPELGTVSVALPARPKRPARTAQVRLTAQFVYLRAPQRPGAPAGSLPPVPCWVVGAVETTPPTGMEAVDWLLLGDARVETFAAAQEVTQQYATRGLIEEFHKGLKTGLQVERLQLKDGQRLFAAVALLSVVAVRLLALRELVRVAPQRPARDSGLTVVELTVLQQVAAKRLPTVGAVALALGRLGGHFNRKRDGWPGWQSLWHGWNKLSLLVDGVRLAKKIKRFG